MSDIPNLFFLRTDPPTTDLHTHDLIVEAQIITARLHHAVRAAAVILDSDDWFIHQAVQQVHQHLAQRAYHNLAVAQDTFFRDFRSMGGLGHSSVINLTPQDLRQAVYAASCISRHAEHAEYHDYHHEDAAGTRHWLIATLAGATAHHAVELCRTRDNRNHTEQLRQAFRDAVPVLAQRAQLAAEIISASTPELPAGLAAENYRRLGEYALTSTDRAQSPAE